MITSRQFSGYILVLALAVTVFLYQADGASATSWKRFEPQEVVQRAELVIQGKYLIPDDSRKRKLADIWIPYEFNVEKYLKGSGESTIQASIELNDVGWVQEVQQKGGTFILFLYKDKYDFWIPVGGPNGMLWIINGELQSINNADKEFYQHYLAKHHPFINKSKVESEKQTKTEQPRFQYLAVIMLVNIFVTVFIMKISSNNHS